MVCPPGAYCGAGSQAPTPCPSGTYSNQLQQTSASACTLCTVCNSGSLETAPCTSTSNRVCQLCSNAPTYATYTGAAGCAWVCNNGYAGAACARCLPGYWCANGIANQCPLYSTSLAGSGSQNECSCNPGYYSQGTILGTSPCAQCPTGSTCPGGGVITVTVTSTPLVNVPAQIVLVQQPLPVSDNLVSLFASIPTNLASIRAALPDPTMTVYTRQVCRGSYCVSCDGSNTCIPLVAVGISLSAGKFVFNVSSVKADSLITFVPVTPGMCAPAVDWTQVSSEYYTGLRLAISSVSGISSIPFICPSNTLMGSSISVLGGGSLPARRRRALLQTISTSDALAVSVVVPANLTNATQKAVASANFTIQGYTPVTAGAIIAVVNTTTNVTTMASVPPAIMRCPENSTSPIGAVSISQCVCLPGYKGTPGSACSPCDPGVFCSGGLIGLCPTNAAAPYMSNSSADCACNPGFYGTGSCSQCPKNAYCPGGKTFINCTANALSPVQSSSPAACYCDAGFEGTANARCQVCKAGTWCWTGVSNVCPLNQTSNPGSSRATDCFCADGYSATSSACILCANNTYCKVSACAKHIYNIARIFYLR